MTYFTIQKIEQAGILERDLWHLDVIVSAMLRVLVRAGMSHQFLSAAALLFMENIRFSIFQHGVDL